MNISLITAVLNEDSIEFTLKKWIDYLEKDERIEQFEIVVCDDCSEISYYQRLEEFSQNNPVIKLLRNKVNEGPGFSFARCIRTIQHELCLITDSDGQFPIENLDSMIKSYMQSSDPDQIIFTHREQKYDNRFNVAGQKISNYLCNWIHGTKLNDFTSAFKLVPSALLLSISLDARYMNYSLDHTSKLIETGSHFVDIPIRCNEKPARKRGLFKEIRRAYHRFLYIFHLWYRKSLLSRRVLFHTYQLKEKV